MEPIISSLKSALREQIQRLRRITAAKLGVKQLGFRSGNWLSAEENSEVLQCARGKSMRAKRDYAMLALLFGCGFRRSELVGLELDEIQIARGTGRW